MPWDTHNFSIDTGFAVDTEFFSPHFRSSTEYGPLASVTITDRDSQTSSLQAYISVDGVDWVASGSPLTASGTLDLSSVRAPYFRWGFKNTTASPGGISTAEVTITSWLASKEDAVNAITVQEQYVYGDFNIAQQMVSGKANATFVGDSITNDQNGGGSTQVYKSFFYGALATWRPAVWGQVGIPAIVPAINATTGLRYNVNTSSAVSFNLKPGEPLSGDGSNYPTSLVGSSPHTFKVVEITANIGLNGNIYSTGWQKEVWDSAQGTAQNFFFNGTESRYFTDSSGAYTFAVDGEDYIARYIFVVTSDPFTGADAGVLSTLSSGGIKARIELPETGASPVDADIDISDQYPASGSKIVWQDVPFTTTSTFPPTEDLYFRLFGNGDNNVNTVIIQPTVLLKRATKTGLGLTYVGQGAWDLTNHAYEYGNPNVVENDIPAYPGAYSDDALKQWIQANDLDVYVFFIGQNDGRIYSADTAEVAAAESDYDLIVERYRRLHREAKGNAAKFVLITNYNTAESDTTGATTASRRRAFNERLIRKYGGSSDCLVVDLDGWIRQQFEYGDYGVGDNQFKAQWTEDGTHPMSLLGSNAALNLYDAADKMMEFVWDRIEYASGSTA